MLFDDNVFQSQFIKHLGTKNVSKNWSYAATFILENSEHIPVVNVVGMDIIGEYDTQISDNIFIELQVKKSVYDKLLATNRRTLKLELRETLTSGNGHDINLAVSNLQTYQAFILDIVSEAVQTKSGKRTNDYRDDLTGLVEIHVHLIELGLSEHMCWDVHGFHCNVTMDTLIPNLLSQPLQALKKEKQKHFNVTMEPAHNKTRYYQLRIDTGTSLSQLPAKLQKVQGVYANGIGSYFQNKMWYVWPLYDIKRYNKAKRRLTIVNIPKNEGMGLTNSYIEMGIDILIYATGDTQHIDKTDSSAINKGTGFRYGNITNILDKFAVPSRGGTEIPKKRNQVVVDFDDRDSIVPTIKPVEDLLSSNPWADSSKITMGLGNIIVVAWENSNPKLLMPGMPLKFIYKLANVPHTLLGTLVGARTEIKTLMRSTTDKRYVSTTVLTLFCERVKN